MTVGSRCLTQSDFDLDGDGAYDDTEAAQAISRSVMAWVAEEFDFPYSDEAFRDYAEVYQQELLTNFVKMEEHRHLLYRALKQVIEEGASADEVYARYPEQLDSESYWEQVVRIVDTREELSQLEKSLKPVVGINALRGDQLLDSDLKKQLYFARALPRLLCTEGPLRQQMEHGLNSNRIHSDLVGRRNWSRRCTSLSEELYRDTYDQQVRINSTEFEHLENYVVFLVPTLNITP